VSRVSPPRPEGSMCSRRIPSMLHPSTPSCNPHPSRNGRCRSSIRRRLACRSPTGRPSCPRGLPPALRHAASSAPRAPCRRIRQSHRPGRWPRPRQSSRPSRWYHHHRPMLHRIQVALTPSRARRYPSPPSHRLTRSCCPRRQRARLRTKDRSGRGGRPSPSRRSNHPPRHRPQAWRCIPPPRGPRCCGLCRRCRSRWRCPRLRQ
jgi:hypothetical protein